jgi:hypothetical protein
MTPFIPLEATATSSARPFASSEPMRFSHQESAPR